MKKKIILFFMVIALAVVSILNVSPIVKADNNVVIEYDEYNYCISITNIESDYIYFYVVSHISNNVWSEAPSSDLSKAENDDSITSYGTYLVNASIISSSDPVYYYVMFIAQAVPLTTYLNNATNGIATQGYNKGYTQGTADAVDQNSEYYFNAGQQYAYESLVSGEAHYDYIYDKGVADADRYYQRGQQGYQNIYNIGYQQGQLDLMEVDENPSFLTMFKAIVNYITDFFKVGLNVEIFGVNIGDFCIGIFLLCAVMFLLRLVFGR